jgi:hypothetical protein
VFYCGISVGGLFYNGPLANWMYHWLSPQMLDVSSLYSFFRVVMMFEASSCDDFCSVFLMSCEGGHIIVYILVSITLVTGHGKINAI